MRLTKRHRQILALLSDGMQTKEVARALFIENKTVQTHIRDIKKRLDAKTIAHIVAIGIRSGEIQ